MQKKNMTQKLVIIALLIAMEVILTRFLSIQTPFVRIGFGFLPIAIIGIMYGPIAAGGAYALGDLLGATLFPSGKFFPGFTLSAFLTGLVYGFFLKNRGDDFLRIVIAGLFVVCIRVGLDTLWLSMLMGQSYMVLLPVRLLKGLIDIPLQIILIPLLWKKIKKSPIRGYLGLENAK